MSAPLASATRIRAALVAATLTATAFGSLYDAGSASDADPAKDVPAVGCQTFSDAAGDAHVDNVAQAPSDPDLDITSLTLRTTSSALVAYIKVADLANGPTTTDGHRYTLDFTFGGHVFSASGSAYKNGTGAIRDALASTGEAGHTTQLGVDVPSLTALPPSTDKGFKVSGLKVTFDTANNWVVMVLPTADITKYAGSAFTGRITAVDAKATVDNYAVSTQADSTNTDNSPTPDAKSAWDIGDNRCFAVATKLALSVVKFPATRNVTARLTTTSGQALAGKVVTFLVNGKRYTSVKTASNGTATVRDIKPGSTVTAQFAAASGYLGSSASKKV
jgi:hypothetical protein